jgi:hypothetical protein
MALKCPTYQHLGIFAMLVSLVYKYKFACNA